MKNVLKQIEIERAAKNRAYSFILAMGLFHEFQTFVSLTNDIPPHELCLELFNK